MPAVTSTRRRQQPGLGRRATAGLALAAALAVAPSPLAAARAPQPPCLAYAPQVVEIIGVLQRESFEREPIEDLFVDPDVVEVEGTPPAAPPPTAEAPAAPPPAGTTPPAAPPAETGPRPTLTEDLPPGTGTPPDPAPADARPPDARPPDARPADARPADARPPDVRPADAVPPAQAPAADVAALPPPLPWPEEAIGPPPPPVATGPDPVLLRARPVRRPPPREQVWVLTLPKPVCVRAGPDDLINTSERNIRKLQLVVDGSLEQGFRQLAKRRVVVRGQLFHATTRRHYLPILVNVEDMRPPEMVEDTTKPPPLPPQP